MSAAKMRFVITGYQGKLQAGWTPPNGPPGVTNNMIRLINQETNEILASIERKRRSDSFPTEPGPDGLNNEMSLKVTETPINFWQY